MGQNTGAISMEAPLQYLLITVKVVALEKLSFSDTQNPKAVNTLTINDEHYLLNRDSLTQPIRCNYLKNKKLFLNFFCGFKNYIKFLTLNKKIRPS